MSPSSIYRFSYRWLLGAVLLFSAALSYGGTFYRAVYFDPSHTSSLVSTSEANILTNYLSADGYQVLGADDLHTFMAARIADNARSVVVFAQDIAPTTVLEGTAALAPQSSTLQKYLLSGGKIVWAGGDYPFYAAAGENGSLWKWGDNGAVAVLGISMAVQGGIPNAFNPTAITNDGATWGLTLPWSSQLSVSPSSVNQVLENAMGGNGQNYAAGWIVYLASSDSRSGFVRLNDHSGPPAQYQDIIRVAEYPDASTPPPFVTSITPNVVTNSQTTILQLVGEGWDNVVSGSIVRPGSPPIASSAYTYDRPTMFYPHPNGATMTFDFSNQRLGAGALVLTLKDGTSVSTPNMVTIEDQSFSTRKSPLPLILGDLTGDGTVDTADVVFLLRLVVGRLKPVQGQLLKGDLFPPATDQHPDPGDGVLNITDVLTLLRHVTELTTQTEIDSTRRVTTLAGTPTVNGFQNGTAAGALFDTPSQMVQDKDGTIYVADTNNHRIRKIDKTGLVSTLAGDAGGPGFADGPLDKAKFASPTGLGMDGGGVLYVADRDNHRIRTISPDGQVKTLAGSGAAGAQDGDATQATFTLITNLAVAADGTVYVVDAGAQSIRKITPPAAASPTPPPAGGPAPPAGTPTPPAGTPTPPAAATVSTLAGGQPGYVNGAGGKASFSFKTGGIAIGPDGALFVSDDGNQRIREITPGGVVTTYAGSGIIGTQDGPKATAEFNFPEGLAVDQSGILYVADQRNNRIRAIDASGKVTTLAGSGAPGTGLLGYADGSLRLARFALPVDVFAAADGSLIVVDQSNHVLRAITAK